MRNVRDNYAEFLKLLLDPKRLAAVMEENNTKQQGNVVVCGEDLRKDDSSDSGFSMGM